MATAAHANIDQRFDTSKPANILTLPFTTLWSALGSIAMATRQAKEIERLSAMNDAQLAARGLRREDIGRSVLGL